MAAPTNTMITTGGSSLVGMREDLANWISKITPETTPFFSFCGTGTARNNLAHDWQVAELRKGQHQAHYEADVFGVTPPKRTVRHSNTCQILREIASVSGTAEAVDKAGRSSEIDWQVMNKAVELRFDVEYALLSDNVKSLTDPRQMSGIKTWTTNYSGGAGGSAPAGDGTTAGTPGATRPLDPDDLDKHLRNAWIKGARIDTLMMHPTQKLLFDKLPTGANLAEAQEAVKRDGVVLTTTVSFWRSTFGAVKLVMNQHMEEGDILGLDGRSNVRPKKAVLPGRNFVRRKPQLNFDGEAEAIIFEGTLEVPNAGGNCLWTDLSTDLAT